MSSNTDPVVLEQSLDARLRDVLPLIQQRVMDRTTYFGVQALKNPIDFWVYQELIHELRPEVIVEIGNRFGGSTLGLAHLCDLLGRGSVIGIDIAQDDVADVVRGHPRVTLLQGDARELLPQVRDLVGNRTAFVIEDSSHTYENTLGVLRAYSELVRPGGYFVVEDGVLNHGLDAGPEYGVYEAIETFVSENASFVVDRSRESFLITWNPKGFLKRIA